MDLSAFPTPRPALNVILLVSASLSILLLLRQLLKALVYWIRQEHAFWGVPTEPVANYLYGHAPFVSGHVYECEKVVERSLVQATLLQMERLLCTSQSTTTNLWEWL